MAGLRETKLAARRSRGGLDAQTEPYPNKPVQIIADLSAGSAPDVALRFVADRLTQAWGQQALVVNRPGAGGSLAARAAAEAAPDGYTLYQPVDCAVTFVRVMLVNFLPATDADAELENLGNDRILSCL